jgi:hypothetical protein
MNVKNDDDDNGSVEEQPQWEQDFYLPPTPDKIPLAVGQRLVAIGDIHGNLRLLQDCLLAAGIARRDDETDGWMWSGGNTICVQVGDLLDRGYEEEKCILLLTKLARQAKHAGGAVVILWGNHEVNNATGDFTCTRNYKDFEKTFGPILDEWKGNKPEEWREQYRQNADVRSFRNETGYAARFAAFEPGGPLSGPFLSNLKVAVQVGRTVLVHAGLRVEHLQEHGGIKGMNEKARDWALTKVVPETKDDPELTASSRLVSALDASLFDFFRGFTATVSGPVWMRDYSLPANREPQGEAEGMVDDVLRKLDVDRLVVGHTVQDGVNSVLEGKVWRIDIGSGIRSGYANKSCIEPYMMVSKIALQITHREDGKEKVVVIKK